MSSIPPILAPIPIPAFAPALREDFWRAEAVGDDDSVVLWEDDELLEEVVFGGNDNDVAVWDVEGVLDEDELEDVVGEDEEERAEDDVVVELGGSVDGGMLEAVELEAAAPPTSWNCLE
jgi:hypothetical protein